MSLGSLILNKGDFHLESSFDKRCVKDHKTLKEFVGHSKALGLRVVLTSGTFDMVHIGHARYLEKAKKHGDLLIVGVDSDKKIKKRKGPERPVVPQDERLEMLTHLRSVDLVFLKELKDPKWALVKAVRPDTLIAVEGTYTKNQIKDLKKYCGKVVVLKRQATTSTSAKIRLLQMGTAEKLGTALTPKIIKTIEESLDEIKK